MIAAVVVVVVGRGMAIHPRYLHISQSEGVAVIPGIRPTHQHPPLPPIHTVRLPWLTPCRRCRCCVVDSHLLFFCQSLVSPHLREVLERRLVGTRAQLRGGPESRQHATQIEPGQHLKRGEWGWGVR